MSQEQSQICPVVELVNDRPATTSLKIAECFDKAHDRVLKDIRKLIADCPKEFSAVNFDEAEYKDEQGKPRPMYIVYFDGFMLLVMGYTGKKALAMKLAYIGAFNAMRERLENRAASELPSGVDAPLTPDQQRTLQDIVDSKVLAVAGGSGPTRRVYYSRIWGNFNKHFRIAKYSQLPQSRLSEGIGYLVNMEIREPKELPQQQALPPSGDKYEAYMLEVEATRGRIGEEISRLMDKGIALVDHRKFGPGCLSPFTYALADWLRDALTRPSPVVDGWRKADNALNYSPVGIFQKMEKDFEYLKGK